MKAFADLLEALVCTPQRNGKLRLLVDYFARTPDPDRGWTLAALTDGVDIPGAKPAAIRSLAGERLDPVLFALSYDYVGDLAETVSLIWPGGRQSAGNIGISDIVSALKQSTKMQVPDLLVDWLDMLSISERFALLKLVMGGLRVGVSARLARLAVAQFGGKPVEEIEELWFGLSPPYVSLFRWLEGIGPRPEVDQTLAYRPMMLAHPLGPDEIGQLDPLEFCAEWKWDGIRILLVAGPDERRLYSRTGDDISAAFPDVLDDPLQDVVLDGELLVVRDGAVAPFGDLQKRLGRKNAGRRHIAEYPAFLRLYDILFEAGEDLRSLDFVARRRRLETWFERTAPERGDLSPMIPFESWEALERRRAAARGDGIEGIMLKRKDSAYIAGRPKGPWIKWKRDPLLSDCVVMYAQRGHGRRSSYFSDYTFGCWRTGEDGAEELVPVGKAYSGFTDVELAKLDKWVRAHTVDRYGPVMAVEPGLVFEVAFDSVQVSSRHKSGLAMRFPRIHRIRWDKPAEEADRVETLAAWIA